MDPGDSRDSSPSEAMEAGLRRAQVEYEVWTLAMAECLAASLEDARGRLARTARYCLAAEIIDALRTESEANFKDAILLRKAVEALLDKNPGCRGEGRAALDATEHLEAAYGSVDLGSREAARARRCVQKLTAAIDELELSDRQKAGLFRAFGRVMRELELD